MKKNYLSIVFVLAILCTLAQANVISKIRDDRSPGYKFENGYGSKASEQGKQNGVGLAKKLQDIVSGDKINNSPSGKNKKDVFEFDRNDKDDKFKATLTKDYGRNHKDKKDKKNSSHDKWKWDHNGKDNGCASVPVPGAVLLAFLGLAGLGWKKH